jgi:homoserine kinase type II
VPTRRRAGRALHGKPAAIVSKLEGSSQMDPQPVHCADVGAMLARMHLAASDFPLQQPNLRGLDWWQATMPQVLPYLTPENARLLQDEVAFQRVCRRRHLCGVAARPGARRPVPQQRDVRRRAPDRLLRLLFCRRRHLAVRPGRDRQRLVHRPGQRRARRGARECAAGTPTARCARSPMRKRLAWQPMLRAAALRFWLSRLYDFYVPREAEMLTPHDPTHFERILRERIATPAPRLANFE